MSALDYKYIAELVSHAQMGDSDAFAELYAATYQKQYHFAYCYLKDDYLAQDALQETYILALKNLSKLKDPTLVIAWLNQINFRICHSLQKKQRLYDDEMTNYNNAETDDRGFIAASDPEAEVIEIDSQEYIMNQILKLPFTEAQVIILKYYQNMKHDDIADLMDISRSSVKRYLESGRKHLGQILQQ